MSLASERQQQSLTKEAVGDNLTSEMAPFSSTTEGRGEEMRSTVSLRAQSHGQSSHGHPKQPPSVRKLICELPQTST